MTEKRWSKKEVREGWSGGVLREKDEGPLSVFQTEQTDSILEDSGPTTESSQVRQKAYSSLESSLDNSVSLSVTQQHTHADRHTLANLNRGRTSAAPTIWAIFREPNTHTQTGLLTLGLNLATKKKKSSQQTHSTQNKAEWLKCLIHVGRHWEAMTSELPASPRLRL